LDVSQLEERRLQLELSQFSLPDLLRDCLEVVAMGLKPTQKAQLELLYDVDESRLPRYVTGDRHRIRQILLNVLQNSAKYASSFAGKLCFHSTDLLLFL
jgi:signal transduction histidine kinase